MSNPSASRAFDSLPLSAALRTNLADLGYTELTDIQAQALPLLLVGVDVIAQAKTGSGKTAAFGLAVLNKLRVERFRVQTLVLCPTRELADQVARELRKLARAIHNIKILTLCGGMPFGPQLGSLEHGAHIVVGTPGRIEEHVRKGTLDLAEVDTLVLDEADRMLDMGFQTSVDAIVEQVPAVRQTLLFSATYPDAIEALAGRVMREPVRVTVASQHQTSSIEQHFYRVTNNEQRQHAVAQLLLHFLPESAVVFCNTKRETEEVANVLREQGIVALPIHGDLEQKQRDQVLTCFANKSASVLVATDVAARGLDIEALDLVVNYHLARDSEVHVHRIGRTGRAGASGVACSLLTEREDFKLEKLVALLGALPAVENLPQAKRQQMPEPAMVTLQIDGGKKQKLRPGDVVGALTRNDQVAFDDIGKIQVYDLSTYVAVARGAWKQAHSQLEHGKLKGRAFRVRRIKV
ncbi:ATP-dependent RNA helicase DbpA [Simiduia aestuariiviva]|uniref:ATP-independent RNA helicase DbpA n=1 Tax=Simiduia aestuariiviva TaxID=1510459 RepID=A0A839UQE8_9GAMM|nr:ATP-dependent RNA helicase DbpA [Simiduia aestuariiviva]MBB3167595.1 ATP-independent RNA helicase DbpA [Simiduia aestuariiviva]